MTAENTQPKTSGQPATVYETVEMSAEQIESQNRQFAAMGLNMLVIDVSMYCGKMELQSDGTYKRAKMPRAK